MTPAELLMRLSLAEADIQFARAKCCQAELAIAIGYEERDDLYKQEMGLAVEAADRARAHLEEIKDG